MVTTKAISYIHIYPQKQQLKELFMSVKLINFKNVFIELFFSVDTLYRFPSKDISPDNAVCSCTAFLSQPRKSNELQLMQYFFQTLMFLDIPNLAINVPISV